MNPLLIETVMFALILAYVFTGKIFVASQRQGLTFVASFDKAIGWGSSLFVIGYCLDAAVYVAWA